MKLTFVIELDGDRLVAHCLELGTASCGKDIPEAIEMIADATAAYIRICLGLEGWPEKFEEWWRMDGYEYDPVAKVWFLKPKRQLWMDDLEMAIDAYRVWLETKHDAEHKIEHGCPGCWVEALEAFDIIFGEDEEDDTF